jgi:DNA polymerase-3 subunit beta
VSLHVKIDREAAMLCCRRAGAATPKKTTLPIIAGLLLRSEGGRLHVTGTDTEMQVSAHAHAEVLSEGALVVSAEHLTAALWSLPKVASVRFESSDKGLLTVASGATEFQLPTLAAGDFPTLAARPVPGGGMIDGAALRRIIDKVEVCSSREETRYLLRSVYLHTVQVGGGRYLRAVATNLNQIAWSEIEVAEDFSDFSVLVSHATALRLCRVLYTAGDVRLAVGDSQIQVHGDDWSFASKVLDGQYVSYQRALPTEPGRKIRAWRRPLLEGLRRVQATSKQKGTMVKVAGAANRLALSVRNWNETASKDTVEVEYDGPDFEVGYIGDPLVGLLSQVSDDVVELEYTGPQAPLVIRDPSDLRSTYITTAAAL